MRCCARRRRNLGKVRVRVSARVRARARVRAGARVRVRVRVRDRVRVIGSERGVHPADLGTCFAVTFQMSASRCATWAS